MSAKTAILPLLMDRHSPESTKTGTVLPLRVAEAAVPAPTQFYIGSGRMEAPAIEGDMRCEAVLALFDEHPHLPALAVVHEKKPIGIVHRTELLTQLAHTYGVSLWARKPIAHLMSKQPLVLACNTTIDDAGNQLTEEWKDGWNVSYILTENGEYAGIGSLFDLLKMKNEQGRRRAAALDRARQSAEQANRSKSDFLAHMSHELRTPLNAVIGFTEIIKDELYGPLGNNTYNEYIGDIHQSANLLLSLINDILDLSKAEAGKIEIRREPVSITRALEQSISILRNQAADTGIQIEWKQMPNLPLVYGDPLRIKQILLNLLSNAIKFTEKGGAVFIRAQADQENRLFLSVTDTGIGIPEKEQQRIFEPFTQVETLLTRTKEGSGLGLPLTKRLVELHDGTLELMSTPGVGTTVAVRLPLY